MKATRDGFGDQLLISGENENVIALSADLGKATKINKFGDKFPSRFFEVGIAENNMIGIASGLADNGFKVFLASFSSFLTGKYDTIRCSLAYSKSPCVLVGTHSGMAIGRDGVTQMGLEDVSIMRSLPNMVVINPSTYIETKKVVKYLIDNDIDTPHYLRLGRQPVKEIFTDDYQFEFGKGVIIKSGKSGTVVFSTGCVLSDVVESVEDLDVSLVNIHTIKPIDYGLVKDYVKNNKNIITVEDHSIIGGLGSAVAEIMAEVGTSAKLTRIGLNDEFPESGKPEDLYEKYGLSSSKLKEKINSILK